MRISGVLTGLFAGVLTFGADTGGLPPRVDRTEYSVAMSNESLAVAAELVPAEKIRRLFGNEVDGRYLVVEVAMYPRYKNPIDVRPGDFTLRVARTRDLVPPQPTGAGSLAGALSAKCLPETSTYRPVAGYLYFPLTEKKYGDREYELEYKAHSSWMILPLLGGQRK